MAKRLKWVKIKNIPEHVKTMRNLIDWMNDVYKAKGTISVEIHAEEEKDDTK